MRRVALSVEAQNVVEWATATSAQHELETTSNHLLQALLSVDNLALSYLHEHHIEAQNILPFVDQTSSEPAQVLELVWSAAESLASSDEVPVITSLHVLAGLLRYHSHSCAVNTLRQAGHDTSRLRNRVISFLTRQSRAPRWLVEQESVRAAVEPAHKTKRDGASPFAIHPELVSRQAQRERSGTTTLPQVIEPPNHGDDAALYGFGPTQSGSFYTLDRQGGAQSSNEVPPSSPSLILPGLEPTHPLNVPNPYLPPPAPPRRAASDPVPVPKVVNKGTTKPSVPSADVGHGAGTLLAGRLKGRFGSRKPARTPKAFQVPSARDLAKSLFKSSGDGTLSVQDVLDRARKSVDSVAKADPSADPATKEPPKARTPNKSKRAAKPAKLKRTKAPKAETSKPATKPPGNSKPPTKPAKGTAAAKSSRKAVSKMGPQRLRRLRERYTLGRKDFPQLSRLGRNLTLEALGGGLDEVVGRDKEIAQLIDILNKRRSNNPILVGPAGVGKTAIVEGLALDMVHSAERCGGLGDKVLVELEMGRLLSGTQLRGSFSERLIAIKDEVHKAKGRVLIFLDEIHTWIGAGASGDGGADAAGELKAALARGEFPCVGATTSEEYRKFIEADPAFRRRMQMVEVDEPSLEDALTIVAGVIDAYSKHHDVAYDDDAVDASVHLSSRYIHDQRLPDKAISILDLAGSRARRMGSDRVGKMVIAEVVCERTGVPVEKLLMQDRERFLRMEENIGAQLIGHRRVVRRVSQAIRRNYAGFHSGRPIGSFLFLGPTGVGKTELVKVLADFLFRDRDAIVRLDMSEYTESHAVSRMVGAPPGYVGFEAGGQLTEAARRKPYQIILFDEIEKAHPEVLNVLLQLLDDGRLTDGQGRTVDFSNTVIVMTSNLGSQLFADNLKEVARGRIGFGFASPPTASGTFLTPEAIKQVVEVARGALTPELWNRIEERLVFGPLSRPEIGEIAHLQLRDSSRRLGAERDIWLETEPSVLEFLIDHGGYDPQLGARPMRQTIQRLVEGPVADMILRSEAAAGDTITVRADGDDLDFTVEPPPSH